MERCATWIAARNMLNAKEVVERFEKTRAKGFNKINVGIDEDINIFCGEKMVVTHLDLRQCLPKHVHVIFDLRH
jgi:hypothetical protein